MSNSDTPRGASDRVGIYFALLIAPLLWASNFVVGRAMHQALPPFTLSLLRWTVALLILLPFFGRSAWEARRELIQKWKGIAWLAGTGIVGFSSALYLGLRHTTALSASMIFATTPLLIILISSWVDRRSVTWLQAGAVTLSVVGALLVLGGNMSLLGSEVFLKGDAIVLLACLIWAAYCVLIKICRFEANGGAVLLAAALLSVVVQLPLSGAELLAAGIPPFEWSSLLAAAYLGVGPAALAFLLWQKATKGIGPVRCSAFLNLIPVFAVAIAVIVLHEALHFYHIVGGACVAFGLALAQTGDRAAAPVWTSLNFSTLLFRKSSLPIAAPPRAPR
jgi:drug/metabolite transporter (DMT)-like permease